MRGKRKIADNLEKDVYLVVDQPNKDIPVYIVKCEHGRGRRRMLHKNLLLPFMALPASKPNPLDTSMPAGSIQPLPVVTADKVDSADQVDLVETSSNDEVSSAKSEDAGTQSVSQPNKYVIPPKRPGYQGSTLNPLATPFSKVLRATEDSTSHNKAEAKVADQW